MKYKKIFFSTLEKMERKKIEKIIINIKKLGLKKKEQDKQLRVLIEYEKEYIKKINHQLTSGMCMHKWKNYNNFISVLNLVIKDNRIILEENKKLIEEKLRSWFQSQKKIKIWKHLNTIKKKQILKIGKIQEQTLNDHYIQLKFLIKG